MWERPENSLWKSKKHHVRNSCISAPSLHFYTRECVAEVLSEAAAPPPHLLHQQRSKDRACYILSCVPVPGIILSLKIQPNKENELLVAEFVVSSSRLPSDYSFILFRNYWELLMYRIETLTGAEGCHKLNILDTVWLSETLYGAIFVSKHWSNARSQRFVYVERECEKGPWLMQSVGFSLSETEN